MKDMKWLILKSADEYNKCSEYMNQILDFPHGGKATMRYAEPSDKAIRHKDGRYAFPLRQEDIFFKAISKIPITGPVVTYDDMKADSWFIMPNGPEPRYLALQDVITTKAAVSIRQDFGWKVYALIAGGALVVATYGHFVAHWF